MPSSSIAPLTGGEQGWGVPDKEIVNFLFTLPIDRLLHLCYIVCNRDVTRMGHGR